MEKSSCGNFTKCPRKHLCHSLLQNIFTFQVKLRASRPEIYQRKLCQQCFGGSFKKTSKQGVFRNLSNAFCENSLRLKIVGYFQKTVYLTCLTGFRMLHRTTAICKNTCDKPLLPINVKSVF